MAEEEPYRKGMSNGLRMMYGNRLFDSLLIHGRSIRSPMINSVNKNTRIVINLQCLQIFKCSLWTPRAQEERAFLMHLNTIDLPCSLHVRGKKTTSSPFQLKHNLDIHWCLSPAHTHIDILIFLSITLSFAKQ